MSKDVLVHLPAVDGWVEIIIYSDHTLSKVFNSGTVDYQWKLHKDKLLVRAIDSNMMGLVSIVHDNMMWSELGLYHCDIVQVIVSAYAEKALLK